MRLIEQRLTIEIRNRGNQFELIGDPKLTSSSAENLLRRLYRETKATELSPDMVHLFLQESEVQDLASNPVAEASVSLRTKKGMIRPRGINQQRYVKEILGNDINFGAGAQHALRAIFGRPQGSGLPAGPGDYGQFQVVHLYRLTSPDMHNASHTSIITNTPRGRLNRGLGAIS